MADLLLAGGKFGHGVAEHVAKAVGFAAEPSGCFVSSYQFSRLTSATV